MDSPPVSTGYCTSCAASFGVLDEQAQGNADLVDASSPVYILEAHVAMSSVDWGTNGRIRTSSCDWLSNH